MKNLDAIIVLYSKQTLQLHTMDRNQISTLIIHSVGFQLVRSYVLGCLYSSLAYGFRLPYGLKVRVENSPVFILHINPLVWLLIAPQLWHLWLATVESVVLMRSSVFGGKYIYWHQIYCGLLKLFRSGGLLNVFRLQTRFMSCKSLDLVWPLFVLFTNCKHFLPGWFEAK